MCSETTDSQRQKHICYCYREDDNNGDGGDDGDGDDGEDGDGGDIDEDHDHCIDWMYDKGQKGLKLSGKWFN